MGEDAMIRQEFYLPRYGWHVSVYYSVTTYWTREIMDELRRVGCRGESLRRACRNLESGNLNTGITYSNFGRRDTVMVISRTSSPAEFLNSWEHEKKHLARHIEQTYGIDPFGEEAAYLEGTIAQKMFPVAKKFICEQCREKLLCGT